MAFSQRLQGAARLGILALQRSRAQAPTLVPKRNITMPDGLRRWMFNLSGFNQYGLYKNDVMLETPEVEEAIRRLPSHLQDERAFRIQRAVQCSVMKTVLPKDQWPTWDEDMEKGRYLEPLLEEVQREKAEQSEWAKR